MCARLFLLQTSSNSGVMSRTGSSINTPPRPWNEHACFTFTYRSRGACLDAAIRVALFDDIERSERGLGALQVQRGQRRAACYEPLDAGSGDFWTIHKVNLFVVQNVCVQ